MVILISDLMHMSLQIIENPLQDLVVREHIQIRIHISNVQLDFDNFELNFISNTKVIFNTAKPPPAQYIRQVEFMTKYDWIVLKLSFTCLNVDFLFLKFDLNLYLNICF